MSLPARRSCFYCGVTETPKNEPLRRCSCCKAAYYCTADHQARHWTQHKSWCYQRDIPEEKWWEKARPCALCSKKHPWKLPCDQCDVHHDAHEGVVDLIIWPYQDKGNQLGWGGTVVEEADKLRATFLGKYNSCEDKFAEYWPTAFRWTCCGTSLLDGTEGCMHHGTASFPCTCHFCRHGFPLPMELCRHTQASYGLQLNCGPDLRSFSAISFIQHFLTLGDDNLDVDDFDEDELDLELEAMHIS